MTAQQPKQVAIVGGGISGLAAALLLRELSPQHTVTLFEASDHVGGLLRSEEQDGYLIEHGPDMFSTAEPWAVDLCQRLEFADDDLLNTDERYRRALVVKNGKLLPIPEGFVLLQPRRVWPILWSPLLSWKGRLRLLMEPFIAPRRDVSDESLQDFAVRRFGQEAFERLIQPLVGGIYTADPQRLSMAATMSRFAAMEREHGSLLRAALADRKSSGSNAAGARYSMFVAPRHGMQQLVERLENRLPTGCVQRRHAVRTMRQLDDGRWQLHIHDHESNADTTLTTDAVILATPAAVTGALLSSIDPQLSADISAIPCASTALAILGYARKHIAHPLNAFGMVVPLREKRKILAASFASIKFAGRAPRDHVLFRVYIGGACQPELLQHDDTELLAIAQQELNELIGTRAAPQLTKLIRWPNSMPQYHVGHLERLARIDERAALHSNLALAGNAYRGVGIPFCIRSGQRAAEKIAAHL